MGTTVQHFALPFLVVFSIVGGQCLENFTSSREFDVCTGNECFIFLDEPPFIFMDEEEFSRRPELQVPFRCGDYRSHSESLKGAFFDIASQMTVRNSYCVWGGPKCTFDEMVSFINKTTMYDRYKWVAGGILFLVPDRIQTRLIGSASLLEDELRVIGPPLDNSSPEEAWATIWKPFTMRAWIFLLICFIGHTAARIWLVCYFTRNIESNRWRVFRERFMQFGASIVSEETPEDEERWEKMNNLWLMIAKIFLGITIILWEVAIAVLVFEARIVYPTSSLSIGNFALWKGTTQEFYFKQLFEIKSNKDPKWGRLDKQIEVFDELTKKNNRSTTLEYSVFTRYLFKTQPGKCRSLREYDDVPRKLVRGKLVRGKQPPRVSGVWIYGINVIPEVRVSINRQIVKLKSEGIRQAITKHTGEKLLEECAATTRRIDWILLGLLLATLPGGLFLVYFVAMLYFTFNPPVNPGKPVLPLFEDTVDTEDDSHVVLPRRRSSTELHLRQKSSKIYRI